MYVCVCVCVSVCVCVCVCVCVNVCVMFKFSLPRTLRMFYNNSFRMSEICPLAFFVYMSDWIKTTHGLNILISFTELRD